MTVTGWRLPEINALPFPAVLELFEYWREHPPVHLLVAAYLGVKTTPRKHRPRANESSNPAAVKDFVHSWGGESQHTDRLPAFLQAAMAADGIPIGRKPN